MADTASLAYRHHRCRSHDASCLTLCKWATGHQLFLVTSRADSTGFYRVYRVSGWTAAVKDLMLLDGRTSVYLVLPSFTLCKWATGHQLFLVTSRADSTGFYRVFFMPRPFRIEFTGFTGFRFTAAVYDLMPLDGRTSVYLVLPSFYGTIWPTGGFHRL